MIKLSGDYYVNVNDSDLWVLELSTNSYKKIIEKKVDSLMWNKKKIWGFSNNEYFIITIANKEVQFPVSLNPRLESSLSITKTSCFVVRHF